MDPLTIPPAPATEPQGDPKDTKPGATGQPPSSQQTKQTQTQQTTQADKNDSLLNAAATEFATGGKLSDKTMDDLQKGLGLSKGAIEKMVSAMAPKADPNVQSLQQRVEAIEGDRARNEIMGAAGGPDKYKQVMAWAATSLSAEDVESYNRAVGSGDVGLAKTMAKMLADRYTAAVGSDGRFIPAPAGGAGGDVYQTMADLRKEMGSQEYLNGNDDYRAMVRSKLLRSRHLPIHGKLLG